MKCRKVRWLSWRHTASKSLDFQLQSLFLTIVALPYCSFLVFKILFYFLTFRILVQFKWVCQVHFISFTAKPGGKDCFQFLCLLFVCEEQNIKVSAASNLLHIPLFFFFLILVDLVSFHLAVSRKSLILSILQGMVAKRASEEHVARRREYGKAKILAES